MTEWTLWVKAIGSAIGSSIAVAFIPSKDKNSKLLKRFVLGTIIGFIFAPIILDFFGWQHTFDYWLAASTLSGLVGYMFLQILFGQETKDRLAELIRKRAMKL